MTCGRIALDHASIFAGTGARRVEAVRDLTLTIEAGELVCVVGPSGCGKSTLLKAIAGYLVPEQGHLKLDGVAIRSPGPDRGMVAQQHTLFPWKTALENVCFGPKMRGVSKAVRRAAGRRLLAEVGLTGFEDCFPAQLSGGMQQRVEIARALINEPKVLLMDEPFSALDAQTRHVMQELLLTVWARHRITTVFVTHDIDEALFLADRVLVMGQRPSELREAIVVPCDRPRTLEVATSAEMLALKRRCLERVREESVRASSPRDVAAGSALIFAE